MKAGSVINVISVFILCVALNTFIYPVFDLGNIPEEFLKNVTSAAVDTVNVANSVGTTVAYNTSGVVL